MTGPRRAIRAALRFVASVLITSGILLIADAGATVTWQEPVSALIASREQGRLDTQLTKLQPLVEADKLLVAAELDPRRRLAKLAERFSARSRRGQAVGRIELPTLDRSYTIIEGTDTKSLRKGPGHFPKTPFPGQRGTVGVAGHRTTSGAPFRTIDRLERGDEVVIEMPYGRFTYRVERSRIVSPSAVSVTRKVAFDRLILSACHPLYSAAKRIVVFARLERAEAT